MSKEQIMTAIIYDKRGNILSVGHNSYTKSHPLMKLYSSKVQASEHKIVLHAEIDALIKAKRRGTPHSIFISRIGAKGDAKLAKPCKICMNALISAGIKKISYTVQSS